MAYIMTFVRDFQYHKIGEVEWICPDQNTSKEWLIERARKLNQETNVNIQFERFQVWEFNGKKFHKKTSKLIYPSFENPLFY